MMRKYRQRSAVWVKESGLEGGFGGCGWGQPGSVSVGSPPRPHSTAFLRFTPGRMTYVPLALVAPRYHQLAPLLEQVQQSPLRQGSCCDSGAGAQQLVRNLLGSNYSTSAIRFQLYKMEWVILNLTLRKLNKHSLNITLFQFQTQRNQNSVIGVKSENIIRLKP